MANFADFKKVEMKAAKILSVEDIPGKDKLYKISIDLGTEKRTMVSGLKQSYSNEELVGKTVIVVSNLEPASIAGIKSDAMVLAAKNKDGKYKVVEIEDSVAAGTLVE